MVLLCLLLYADAESKLFIHLCLGLGHDEQFCFQLMVTKGLGMSLLLSNSSNAARSSLDHSYCLKRITYAASLLFLF